MSKENLSYYLKNIRKVKKIQLDHQHDLLNVQTEVKELKGILKGGQIAILKMNKETN